MDDYSDDGLYGFDDDDDGDEPFADDFFEDDKADEATPAHKESTVLSLDDLQAKKQELVDNAAAVLNLPGHQAEQLLRLFAWDANKLNEEWFTNEQRCREKVGLLRAVEEPTVAQRELCKICFEAFDIVTLRGASCGHLYCEGCYRRYISEAIRNGPSCLNLRCPTPDCGAMVRFCHAPHTSVRGRLGASERDSGKRRG